MEDRFIKKSEIEKIITDGSTGEVLSKKSNSAGDVEWKKAVSTFGDLIGQPSDNELLSEALNSKLNADDYNQHFRGRFATIEALNAASFDPELAAGDYAQIDEVNADVKNYNWDVTDNSWVEGGSGSAATNTDQLPEGAANLYFTTERMAAAVIEAKKNFEKDMYVFAKLEVYFPMATAGRINSIITDGLSGVQVKINTSGVYSPFAPLVYNAGDRIYFSFGYLDPIYQEGSIILKGKDN